MKISIITPNISGNCMGRAWLLARILQRRYEVEIVGPMFGDGVWEPLAPLDDVEHKSVPLRGILKPYWQIRELSRKIDGDVVYATKPLFTSFGVGIYRKVFGKKVLILDIDDWEWGFAKEALKMTSFKKRIMYMGFSSLELYHCSSYWNRLLCDRLARFADDITVSNRFLQDRFGGELVWHARDTQALDPAMFDKGKARERYEVDKDKKVVMFFGSPGAHKGLEDLIEAVNLIEDKEVVLVIVGFGSDEYSQRLMRAAEKILGERFRKYGLQPIKKVPEFLAMADVVAICQRKNWASVGQMPAKVFDAMAMAKPIVATSVSDIPEVLEGCGWSVEPENPNILAEAISYVLTNHEEAEKMGMRARQRCIERYSWDTMENVLVSLFEKYE